MFHKEFYPTPFETAYKMLDPYRDLIKSGISILDPSAGKGDLLDRCKTIGASEKSLFAVEINTGLCQIITGKKYRVIGSDFLQYNSSYLFGLICMNPPFSNGDEHLLKAWDVLRSGHIVCLLNAETIRNPHTAKRKLLQSIIEQNGSVEYIGNPFVSAERKTGVEVALVRLEKKAEKEMFDFSHLGTASEQRRPAFDKSAEIDLENQVAKSDFINALVSSYDQVASAYEDFMSARKRLNFYVNSLCTSPYGMRNFDAESIRRSAPYSATESARDMYEFNAYLDAVKHEAWQTVFNRSKMRELLTSKMRDQFNEFQQSAQSLEFTEQNIWAFFEMLVMNRGENMKKCVVEVFDLLTSYDKKNVIHWEGWKTNSRYRVNRKVIMPWFIEYNGWAGFSFNHRRLDTLRDIDRVMCHLTGKRMDDTDRPIKTIEDALRDKFKNLGDEWVCESEFFKIQFFKKGTIHLTFLDEWLWKEFNRTAAEGKNWIGAE